MRATAAWWVPRTPRCRGRFCVPETPATLAACAASPAGLVVCGAGVNGVTIEASADPAAYPYIAAASCAHISPYSASLAAIAGPFWPKKLVAFSVAS